MSQILKMAEFYQFAFLLSKMPSIFNEKQIEELTQLAKENVDFAPRIVKLIQDHLFASNKSRYFNSTFHLIENIVKNDEIGGVYGTLFSNKIASLFSSVFRTADKSTRRSMFIKRKEWLNLNMFPIGTLYALDVEVKSIDPNWPAITRPFQLHAPPQPIVSVSSLLSSSNANSALNVEFVSQPSREMIIHLDWHFQQNRIRKNDRKQFMNRACF